MLVYFSKKLDERCLSLKTKNYSLSDATQRRLWENLRDLKDVSEETSLTNLQQDVPEICKSALFETSLRRCIRRLRDASEMHPCPLRKFFIMALYKWKLQKYNTWNTTKQLILKINAAIRNWDRIQAVKHLNHE